jgi:16S rRNA G966 N2-methylase RsmD
MATTTLLTEYINQGIINIPKDIQLDKKLLIDAFIMEVSKGTIQFPYKKLFMRDNDDKIERLMIYKPIISNDPFDITRFINKKSNKLNYNKYKGNYVCFVAQEEDYDNIDILTDYFTDDQRMIARNKKSTMSPIELWSSKEELSKLISKMIDEKEEISSYNIREYIYKLKYECNSFKLTLASSIYWLFDAKKILDISAGWGDRLLAAIAHYADRYMGVDPNTDLIKGHTDIIKTLTQHRDTTLQKNKYEVAPFKFESPELILEREEFDLVFTSPPYFDLEIYTEKEGQSITSFPNFQSWLINFLFVSIKKAWTSLTIGGNMVIHIQDFERNSIIEPMILFVLGWCDGSNYDGVIGSKAIHSGGNFSAIRPMWVFSKDSRRSSQNEDFGKRSLEENYNDLFRHADFNFIFIMNLLKF